MTKLELLWAEGFTDPAVPHKPLPFRLTSLSLWLERRPTPAFLRALFSACTDSLDTLHLRSDHPETSALAQQWLLPVLHLVAPRVRHLVLEQTEAAPWHLLPDGLNSFTSLETLGLGVVGSPYSEWTLTAGLFNATVATLPRPPKLRRLALGIKQPRNLDGVIPFLSDSRLRNLKQIDLPLELRPDVGPLGGDAFLSACSRMGVKVALRHDLGLAKEGELFGYI